MIVFENQEPIDVHAITTIGVNAKESNNPIGYFGTGLKYAIAIILRNGGNITIQSDGDFYTFDVEEAIIRGKPFQIITMNGEKLGFTTHFGVNWEVWQAFRELYCNALDENGTVYETKDDVLKSKPFSGTRVMVSNLPEFDHWFLRKNEIVLESEPVYRHQLLEIHDTGRSDICYRGIRAKQVGRAAYQYNFTVQCSLTEDRTIKDTDYWLWDLISRALWSCPHEHVIEKILTVPDGYYEKHLTFSSVWGAPSDAFRNVINRYKNDFSSINRSAMQAVLDYYNEVCEPEPYEMSKVEKQQLKKALKIVNELGYDIDMSQITCTKTLGKHVLGLCKQQKIYLAQRVFEKGTKMVASTLLEEAIHLINGAEDYTREFQDILLDKIITLYEGYTGSPV